MSVPARAILFPLFFAGVIGLNAQARYTGTIDSRLRVVDGSWATFVFEPATKADLQSLPPADKSGPAYSGLLPETHTRVVIIDNPANAAFVYADLNRDGKYSTKEKFRFHGLPANVTYTADTRGWPTRKACFDIPIAGRAGIGGKSFEQLPVCIQLYDPVKSTIGGGSRSLDLAIAPWVIGSVTAGSRQVSVGYEYDLKHDSVDPMNGWLGLHDSARGPINFLSHSPETAYAEKEQVVFRAGDLYLSTESIDLKRHSVVLRAHPAADYIRIELRPGTVLPDWTFVDLKGRPGSLKSYAGKYVMLDVWTPSCGPCLGEFAMLKSVAARFESRNFEILGVLGADEEPQARRTEQEHGLPWRTAASSTTFEYAEQRLRIASWPTHILLDPNGRIVTTSSSELRGEALLKTLQGLLPH